jgi:hypothetical protein
VVWEWCFLFSGKKEIGKMDSVIQFEGTIYEDGYGLLAQKVMRDKTLPKQSKLIYAYMCSFASVGKNGERTAFPSVSLQCAELGMSEDTYYKWRKFLIEKGYIKIKRQRQEHAKFDNNIYSIIAVPVEVKTDETVEAEGNEPHPKKSGTAKKPYPKKPCTVNPSTEKSGTNSISSNSTSFNKEEEEEEEEKEVHSELIQFLVAKQFSVENAKEFEKHLLDKGLVDYTNDEIIIAYKRAWKDFKKNVEVGNLNALAVYKLGVILDSKKAELDKVVELKEKKKTNKKPVRTEMLPDWFEENEEKKSEPVKKEKSKEEIKAEQENIDEMLKKLRS